MSTSMRRTRVVAALALGAVVLAGGAPCEARRRKPKSTLSAKVDRKALKAIAVVVTHIGTSFGASGGTGPKPFRIGGLVRTIAFLCEVNLAAVTPPATLTQASSQCGGEYVETHLGNPKQMRWQSSVLSLTLRTIAGRTVKGEFEGTFDPTDDHPGDPSHTVTKGKFSVVLAAPVS